MADAMGMMEHPESTISVPPLVDERVLQRFCNAVQSYADSVGSHDEAAKKLRELRARLTTLRGLASLCRLAIVGHPHSVARVVDEMFCLSVDFPSDPLEDSCDEVERNQDEPDDRVQLAAAVDLFAGASFVSKDRREQRDGFIIGVVRAIEDAIAFPVTFSAEAATYLGEGDGTLSMVHARIVITNATQRLLDNDQKCVPRAPKEIRGRLACLAKAWMCANPVDLFFHVISGPRLRRIVHWEDPERRRPDAARVGDRVTLLLRDHDERKDPCAPGCGDDLRDLGVMFCPHQPAAVIRVVEDGLQTLVPAGARTGPIAIVKKAPDFTAVKDMLAEYADAYPFEWPFSIFSVVRMDMWAYPVAFGMPVLKIMQDQDRGLR
ncbi:MAG TPA: hypothetical protein VGG20_15945 [Thermoanaerobaculia bacterium]|jgi:hypothetical protein